MVDATDGATAETGLTLDVYASTNGAAFATLEDTGTHRTGGCYSVAIDSTEVATVGRFDVLAVGTGARSKLHSFQVVEEATYDALYAASAPGLATVSTVEVATSRTWFAVEYRARNIVQVGQAFTGTLAMQPDLNPDTTISSVTSVVLSGPASVTANTLTVTPDKTAVHFNVPALATAGTYTVTVTVATVDGQTIVTTGTLQVI